MFRGFQRSSSPLSGYLAQHYTSPGLDRIESIRDLAELAEPEAVVESLLAEFRIAPPTLGEGRNTVQRFVHRPVETGGSARTVRQFVRYPVDGDIHALEWWPDGKDTDAELPAVDDGLSFRALSSRTPRSPATDLADHEAQAASDRWIVAGDDDRQRDQGLHTFVEVLASDMGRVRSGEINLGDLLRVELHRVEPIIAAIAEQHRRFFDELLPELLREAVARQCDLLAGLSAVRLSTGFPADWQAPEPRLTPAKPETTSDGASEDELRLPGGPTRLDDASFAQVLRNVRVWADAVEQHPEAYRQLVEDRISDLLVVSLNTALPGAHREVYCRGGKADIFIRANALPNGTAPAKVFVGENKKYSGPTEASTALDQLLNYLQVRHTSALLILLVDRVGFARAHTLVTSKLRARADYIRDVASPVEGWPLLRFDHHGHIAEVCVATINTSEPPGHPDSSKRKRL
ncbi:hypothetical protein LQ327_33440 [Actinomycetospora endophytica]|uniref:Restriction endonuclease n=1 Tax=Actinomycetospora endophytica TaxID=2291215 RepID=A0ABS8PLI8_9PSEU|nr:hypothetical protein [Actinomycetospora endophytica]MCD2198281.1 hypothetical protein [Actinomycetospora endophytica]